jgi:hypothetical protein
MFKNFDPDTDLAGKTPAKSSAQRDIVKRILQQYPLLKEEVLEAVLPVRL